MDVEVLVIGAGVVGLAIAAKVSENTDNVFIIEKHLKFGQETSSRNSEVIHSGIYYTQGSLKAKFCFEGRDLLYNYCDKNDIWYNKCGKLIIATNDFEESQFISIYNQAKVNGVNDHRIIGVDEIKDMEPHIFARKAIHFPSTAMIDAHDLMHQLETDAINNDAKFIYGAEVIKIQKSNKEYIVTIKDADNCDFSFTCKKIINSAGLSSQKISELVGISDDKYKLCFWKGEYFSVVNGKNKLLNSLIYPVPESNTVSLGIHTTIDKNNRLKLGPNALFLDNEELEYSVNEKHKIDFYNSVVRFLPFIELEDLYPDQAGIRTTLQSPGDASRDFIIKNEKERGYDGFINLIGIESPGLTSCLAIAKYVESLLN